MGASVGALGGHITASLVVGLVASNVSKIQGSRICMLIWLWLLVALASLAGTSKEAEGKGAVAVELEVKATAKPALPQQ